jgi:hypothetical protein
MAEKWKFQDDWERSSGFVYFIAAGNPISAVKIGISSQKGFKNRMRQIQSANHEPLRILGVIPFEEGERPMMDAIGKEAELHARFSEFRRFKNGWVGSEWFSFSTKIQTAIQEEAIPPTAVGLPVTICQLGPAMSD